MQKKIEIEFKWAVTSSRDFSHFLNIIKEAGAKASRAKNNPIADYYIDTLDQQWGQSRIACRLRRVSQKWELTLKTRNQLKNGLAKRVEMNIAVPCKAKYPGIINYCRNSLFKTPFKDDNFVHLFTIFNHRTTRHVQITSGTHAELCFDRVKIIRKNQVIKMMEIELEFLKGRTKEFDDFTRRMTRLSNLKPSKQSKVKTALNGFHLEIPENRRAKGLTIDQLIRS